MKRQGLRKVVTIFTVIAMVITLIIIGLNSLLPIYLSYKFNKEVKEASAIGIIGGADGPTAIYLTGKLSPYIIRDISALISILGSVYLILTRKNK